MRLNTVGRDLGQLPAVLMIAVVVVTVGGIPTSVLTSTKETNAIHHGPDTAPIHQSESAARFSATASPTESKNQISVPQKRGVNPLLYNDLDFSGPRGGQWDDDLDGGPLGSLFPSEQHQRSHEAGARLRNYDLLASLLGAPVQTPSQTFYDGPVTPSVSYPYMYYGLGGRNKRMANFGAAKSQQRSPLRPKRSPGKLSAADALSLLALLDSRDPYPALSDYFPYVAPANGPNDVLPYSPNSVYSLMAPYGADDDNSNGQWMNTWTDPAVDYLGFPLDAESLARLDSAIGGGGKPSKIGYTQQKRFMITKRKRSVGQQDDQDDENCSSNTKGCLLRKYGQLAASKVAPA